ncbi:hypothetical protein ACNO5E_26330, partial [Vibrio parahaemolyticus]
LSKNIPTRLFITVGRPGAGKTTWISDHKKTDSLRYIYYDSTANDRIRRQEIISQARRHANCIITLVYFDIDVEECVLRNRQRGNKAKIISDEYIREFRIDVPSVAEKFDELLIVRN